MKRLTFVLLASLMLGLVACSKPVEVQMLSGAAQGTTWHVSVWSDSAIDTERLQEEIEAEFLRIDKMMSNYRQDSIIEQFNRNQNPQAIEVGKEIVNLVNIARQVSQATNGCYDLTVKPLFDLWGFSKDVFNAPSETDIQNVIKKIGLSYIASPTQTSLLKKQPELSVDLSSIAQGYSVSRIAKVVESAGITDYLVEIGGELQTRGHKPDESFWRIAIERPLPGDRAVHKVIDIKQDDSIAIMTSGTYRHYFDEQGQRYSHILDARTGKPVTHSTLSVTVLDDDPTQADAWSTALLCLGENDALRIANKHKIAALFISDRAGKLAETSSIKWGAIIKNE
ncbi:FAD:protein FMN transferase [Pseudoalteromonas lipolytica]|uniref:FAD:protein FMN transferase n=1 Tax=Pseudoalteromonas lipolytica TaxID=570156 RepID=A0ABY1GTD7_9GAMM|nr:FAD:protein FMN transferase [Pseudoalteromonas lipolytica]MBE0351791.1 thiamine biosynthesis lipoprotein [Pseudoalteromonas lipolytica LMEB 39]SFT99718.1 thiamine biosynthesis lipoprotein [Pseudoalteromonas lipolytica]